MHRGGRTFTLFNLELQQLAIQNGVGALTNIGSFFDQGPTHVALLSEADCSFFSPLISHATFAVKYVPVITKE